MNIIKVKTSLQKNILGRVVLKIYHYCYSVPMSYFSLIKYKLSRDKIMRVSFYDNDTLFKLLTVKHKSLTRFGDGEIAWIYKDAKGYFGQENSEELSDALKMALTSNRDSLIVGIPDFFGDMKTYTKERKRNREIHLSKYLNKWRQLIDVDKVYADALITRVYNGRVNFDCEKTFNQWKQVWDNRVVYIIEGAETRFGVGNDLLSNAKQVQRIICPAENAFCKYKDILNCSKQQKEADLFLIALGPTASVLAYDLDLLGFQAIDIGHLDIEYEWYVRGAHTKTPISGKYVNEAGGTFTSEIDSMTLSQYNNEIVAKVL